MAAITNISEIINVMTGGGAAAPQRPYVFFDARVGSAAAVVPASGRVTSLWQYNKSNGQVGAVPSGGLSVATKATQGGMPMTNAGGGRELWLTGWEGMSSRASVAILYDRLLQSGGLSGTVTNQVLTETALTRNTSGIGNEIWIEIYDQVGTTTTSLTVSYVDSSDATRTTPAVVFGGTGNREAQRIIRLPLEAGSTGVKTVKSVAIAASTALAGNFGVLVVKPVGIGNFAGDGSSFHRDYVAGQPGPIKIENDACLAFALLVASAVAPFGFFQLHLMEK